MAANAGDPIARVLQGIDTPVDPRPEFADALLQRLLGELEGGQPNAVPVRRAQELPTTLPAPLAPAAPPAARASWSRWAVVQVATLLLVLGSVILALVLTRRQEPPVLVPAIASPLPAIDASPVAPPTASPEPVAFRWRYADPEDTRFALSPGITVAPDGNLWVVDGAQMGFQILSSQGEVLEHWGAAGKGNGQFNFKVDAENALSRVAFRDDGGFYVADAQNRRIQQFAADRSFVRAWGSFGTGDGQFVQPVDVLVDTDGNVYVTDAGRHDVQKFAPGGQFLLRFGGQGEGDGQFSEPGWGAVAVDGTLWIPDTGNNRLQHFAPDGTFLQAMGSAGSAPGEFDTPQGIAIDGAGRLYVTDSENSRVQVFSGDGQFIFAFDGADASGAAFTWPIGIAVDAQHRLYVHDYDRTELVQQFQIAPAAIPPIASPVPRESGEP